jgi:hypothetical protein
LSTLAELTPAMVRAGPFAGVCPLLGSG